jgi:hypothetical protein
MAGFAATLNAVAVTAAQDVFELNTPTGCRVRIREVRLGQYTDFGDAAAEILSILFVSGYTVSGSGGSTATPVNLSRHSGGASAVTTVETNNTTVANTGTAIVLLADAWNIQAPFLWQCPENPLDNANIYIEGGGRFVVRITAPADSITLNATIVFEEVGMLYP